MLAEEVDLLSGGVYDGEKGEDKGAVVGGDEV